MGSCSTAAICQKPPSAVWCRFATSALMHFLTTICLHFSLAMFNALENKISCRFVLHMWSVFNSITFSPDSCAPKLWRKGNVTTLGTAPLLTAKRRRRCGCIWRIITVSFWKRAFKSLKLHYSYYNKALSEELLLYLAFPFHLQWRFNSCNAFVA